MSCKRECDRSRVSTDDDDDEAMSRRLRSYRYYNMMRSPRPSLLSKNKTLQDGDVQHLTAPRRNRQKLRVAPCHTAVYSIPFGRRRDCHVAGEVPQRQRQRPRRMTQPYPWIPTLSRRAILWQSRRSSLTMGHYDHAHRAAPRRCSSQTTQESSGRRQSTRNFERRYPPCLSRHPP